MTDDDIYLLDNDRFSRSLSIFWVRVISIVSVIVLFTVDIMMCYVSAL